ncbi:MAG TPA: hypothetical protein VFO12_11285 [Sphingomicrobium sp.]|nr:hypothetical protein [Sphingomicrobium sp.]
MRLLATSLLLTAVLTASPALAQGLTVRTGETWSFRIANGQPVKARKVAAQSRPKSGEVVVTVRSMMGTTMTIISNNRQAYTYKAELIGAEKAVATRSCTLPANARMSFENWPQTAKAVRLSQFKVATKDGACP